MTTVVLFSGNTPTKDDRGWPHNPERTDALIHWLNQHHVKAAALQEVATVTRQAWADFGRWDLVLAAWNNVFGANTIGNVVAVHDPAKVVQSTNIRIRTLARPRGLNMAVALIDFDGALAVMIAFHLISGRTKRAQRSRARCLKVLIAYAHRCERTGLPVILAGDTNSGVWAERVLAKAGFNVPVREGVDLIAVSKTIRTTRPAQTWADGIGRWTDHHMVTVTAHIPDTSTANRLPRRRIT